MLKKFIVFVVALLGLVSSLNAFARYSVQSIPNPKQQGHEHYVSDPDHNLSSATIAQLDAISSAIEKKNGSEFAIVVVNDYMGGSDFEFALNLFNHWGIGKLGANNGLLLFLSMDRHQYRFVTGYGLEGILPDILLGRIGREYLVPYMKDGDTDMAVLAAAKAVESVFLSPEHELELAGLEAYRPTFWNRNAEALNQALYAAILFFLGYVWMGLARKRVQKKFELKATKKDIPHWGSSALLAACACIFLALMSLFVVLPFELGPQVYRFKNLPYFVAACGSIMLAIHYYVVNGFLATRTKDVKKSLEIQAAFARLCAIPLLLMPFAYKAFLNIGIASRNARLRGVPPTEAGNWKRISRDEIKRRDLKNYLSAQQLKEESLESRTYEIWVDEAAGKKHLTPFPSYKSRDYETCPKCHGQTLAGPKTKVIKRATYKREGTGERIQSCQFCDYSVSLGMIALAKLSHSSSSSSSSSGGGSSSSSSSFGGGSSGGGGAGGSW